MQAFLAEAGGGGWRLLARDWAAPGPPPSDRQPEGRRRKRSVFRLRGQVGEARPFPAAFANPSPDGTSPRSNQIAKELFGGFRYSPSSTAGRNRPSQNFDTYTSERVSWTEVPELANCQTLRTKNRNYSQGAEFFPLLSELSRRLARSRQRLQLAQR
jgi:hypothetical protein